MELDNDFRAPLRLDEKPLTSLPIIVSHRIGMVTGRRFCRLSRGKETSSFDMPEVPESGLCLSAFLVITEENHPTKVLMGHLNPDAPWDHMGALDSWRIHAFKDGWMLPSSHLILLESPEDAAKRILKEQLEIDQLKLSGPIVGSEISPSRRNPDHKTHWDIEFIFTGELAARRLLRPKAWREIKFVDLTQTIRSAIARSHEDILESAGLKISRS